LRNRILLDRAFKSGTPVLPHVYIIDAWGYHDGPLFGVCEIRGERFFFMDVIYDIWRYYKDDTHQRLWSVFAVYDINIVQAEKLTNKDRLTWQDEIEGISDCLGIFWEYEEAGNYKEWKEQ